MMKPMQQRKGRRRHLPRYGWPKGSMMNKCAPNHDSCRSSCSVVCLLEPRVEMLQNRKQALAWQESGPLFPLFSSLRPPPPLLPPHFFLPTLRFSHLPHFTFPLPILHKIQWRTRLPSNAFTHLLKTARSSSKHTKTPRAITRLFAGKTSRAHSRAKCSLSGHIRSISSS